MFHVFVRGLKLNDVGCCLICKESEATVTAAAPANGGQQQEGEKDAPSKQPEAEACKTLEAWQRLANFFVAVHGMV